MVFAVSDRTFSKKGGMPMRTSAVIVAVSIMILGASLTVDAQCVTRVADWPFGPTFVATGDGNHAVYSSGRALMVADISNPAQPTVVGSLTLDNIPQGAVIDGGIVFVALLDSELQSVDISDPSRPTVVGSFPTTYGASDLVLQGDLAYVASQDTGLLVLDVSDPTAPTQVGILDFDERVYDVAVHGDVAYLANYNDGVQIVDVSDPSAPTVLGSLGDIGRTNALDVSGDGQLVVATDRYEGDFRIIDVSDPAAPVQVGLIDHTDYALDVALDGNIAYLSNRNYGLRIYDISNPAAPVDLGSIDIDGSNERVAVHGNLAYLANNWSGLRLADITVPAEAEELGFIETFARYRRADMDGGLAVIAGGIEGYIFDVSDPTTPAFLASIDPYGYVDDMLIDGDLAYIAADRGGIHVVDVSDPSDPTVIGTAETCDAYRIAKYDDTVFVGCYDDGLSVVDVSSSTEPREIGRLDGFRAVEVVATGGILYARDWDTGIHIVDVSDPTTPVYLSALGVPTPSHQPTVNGDRLFVPTSRDGVFIYDVTNPREPIELGNAFPTTYFFGIAPIGDLLFIASIYSGGYVYDISTPAAPSQVGTVDFATFREGEVTWEGSLVMTTETDGGFEIFDLAGCFNESPTAGFTWRPGNPEAGRTVQLTDTSFGTIATRSWDFGDGGTSTDRYPTHVWTETGAYEVTLTVSGPMGSDSITQTVSVNPSSGSAPPITDPGTHVYVIAASAHAPGLASTQWVTDAVLHNPGSEAAEAYLWFMEQGQNNTGAEGVGVTVAPGASVLLEDVVLSLFGGNNVSGAVLVGSNRPLLVTSRTYNDAATGTYGQFIPGRDVDSGVGRDETVHLVQLTRNSTFRANLGVANPTAASVSVDVSLHDADGTQIGTRTLNVPPFGFLQQTDILGADVEDAYAVVSSSTAGASFFPYASVVDNRTGDPFLVEPIEPDGLLVVAAAAHVGGYVNTDWKTDLEVCNTRPGPTDVEVRMLASQQNNSNPASVSMNLAGGACTRVTDVLETSFSFEGTAALEIRTAKSELIASSRTFNTTTDGTYGQFLPGIPTGDVLGSGQEARAIQLRQDTSDTSGFRTNLGFVNRSASSTSVDVQLDAADGSSLGSITVNLLPFEHRQINRVFRQVTPAPVPNGTITVSSSTSGGAFVAYASVVDNSSGDPVCIPALPVAN
jgi:PKD repeat protein